MLAQTSRRMWCSDFWEHAAVVRELATNPLSPRNPLISSGAPHAFYSPYAVLAGLISRATGMNSIRTLEWLGVANLALLLISFRMFSDALLKRREAAFYLLLFTLVLWGREAWEFSGFFHLRPLGQVLPYPSTFATAVALCGVAIYDKALRSENLLWLALTALACLIVALTHPTTLVFFSVCIFSLTLARAAASEGALRSRLRSFAFPLACVFVLPLALAALWPYYPFYRLLFENSAAYDAACRGIYSDVLKQIWPALFGIPLLIWRFKSNRADPVSLITAILVMIYAYGAFSHRWGLGRVISHIVLMLHLCMADAVAQVEASPWARISSSRALRIAFAGVVTLAVLSILYLDRGGLISCYMSNETSDYRRYEWLSGATGQYDVVLSDLETSVYVPAFAGKVVGTSRVLHFVPDADARNQDVMRFLSTSCTRREREAIIRKYGVKWLLLNKENVPGWATIAESFRDRAQNELSSSRFLLMRLK